MSEPGSNHWRRAPLRFVWQMDAEHRFKVGSEEFAALMGPATAAALGRPWPELTAALSLDPEGQIARALASRDTWSGLSIAWPVDEGSERLAVELSGLPVFDRERTFLGYRGFGICRDVARLATLGGAVPSATPAAENVVPLRPASQPVAPSLSPVERSAFHELTRKLHERLKVAGSPAPTGASLAQAVQEAQEAQTAQELPPPPAIKISAADPGAALAPSAPERSALERSALERAQAEILELKSMLDRKADEELAAAKRQSEKVAAARSDFLAKISYLIRTPLNAIVGFSEIMAQERFGPIGNERYRQYLGDIQSSGENLLTLVNDLLDLSKIDAGKLALDFAGVALNALTQQCVADMQRQANRERIIIRTSLSPRLPPVLADARSLRQMLLNLIAHAAKCAGAGGQVIVSTTLTDLGEAVLRVHHGGVGIGEAEIALALEPFRQIATAARPGVAVAGADGPGLAGAGRSGLGLPLIKALAEANRATLRITSAPQAGTLIEVAFPPERVLAEDRP
jgi:signal transduction histidine kinase